MRGSELWLRGAFRQDAQLAEGQKSTHFKHFLDSWTPSARQRQLAEGVEFFEKYATFVRSCP
jgi:hypothetical protein